MRHTATGLDGRDVVTTKELADAEAIQEVSHIGLGLCLVDMGVIHRLAEEPLPFFEIQMIGDGTDFRGEDFYFFERVRKAGFAVHLDHHLSWRVGHVMQKAMKSSDALGIG
jgi:hypothetical protein